jgi:hypothetical protein
MAEHRGSILVVDDEPRMAQLLAGSAASTGQWGS